MNVFKVFKSLCTPAQLYLGLSILSILGMCFQNMGNPNVYACGLMKATTPINNIFFFIPKVLYVLGWTYLLNILCQKGYNKLSWLLVLLPFIAMFILIGLLIVSLRNI